MDDGGDACTVHAALIGVDFAAVLQDRTVVMRSDKDYGGDARTVQAALDEADTIYCTGSAFAAMLHDMTVVT